MAEEFTFANVRRAVHGIAHYVASQKPRKEKHRIIVGRDPRFLGETFVELAQQVLAEHDIIPLAISEPAPTPAITMSAPTKIRNLPSSVMPPIVARL